MTRVLLFVTSLLLIVVSTALFMVPHREEAPSAAAASSSSCGEWSDYHDIPMGAVSERPQDHFVFWGKTCLRWESQ